MSKKIKIEKKDIQFYVQLPKKLEDLLFIINKNGLGTLFIVDDNEKLQGALTDGDIRRALLMGVKVDQIIDYDFKFLNTRPFWLPYNTSVQKIMKYLNQSNQRIKCIPLLNEKGKIVDISTRNKIRSFPNASPEIGEEELSNVIEAVSSGYISSVGKYIEEFENKFEDYLGQGHAIAVSSGTSALQLGLSTLGLKRGDEVILPNFTFGGSINSIINCGATPVLVDINKDNWTIDLEEIKKNINKNTRAIMPVHIYGQPAQLDEICDIANENNLTIIEDCAEAIGAKYKNKIIGTHGDCSCFSFFANKTLTTGEGGMVIFKNKELAEKAKILRDHGMSKEKKYWHEYSGFNYRMTNMQAAIGVAQIEKIEIMLNNKKRIFNYYDNKLNKNKKISLLPKNSWSENSYWIYNLRVEGFGESDRDNFLKILKNRGIDCRPGFYPLNLMKPYKTFGKKTLKVSEEISRNSISLPSAANLTNHDQDYIIDVFNEELNRFKN